MVFIRTNRPDRKIFYDNEESFEIVKSKIAVFKDSDKLTIIGAGVTFDFTIEAAEKLKTEGVNVRVVYSFSVKPIDKDFTLKMCFRD
jgi:transketolase C-terminal domain/subunit